MARQLPAPRKQRTREHVIADQSVNFVERCVIDAVHTVQRLERDYGYDLVMFTYDEQGYVEPGVVYFQLKAAESLKQGGSGFAFDLDVRDYHLWMAELMPVILVLYDAGRRKGYWLHIQAHFERDIGRRPKSGAKTVRVHVPRRQVMNQSAAARIRQIKEAER